METQVLNTASSIKEVCQETNQRNPEYSGIPSQKWNGNNNLNNSVTVDYVKKTVDFKPILVASPLRMFIVSWFGAAISCAYATSLAIILVSPFAFIQTGTIFHLFQIGSILIYAFSFALIPVYFNKWFVREVFPKFNYGNIQVMGFFRALKKRTVEPHSIVDNKLIIPCFSNVYIGYETDGDFSTQLERVEIKNIFKEDVYKWFAVFYFKEKPVNGVMRVEYV